MKRGLYVLPVFLMLSFASSVTFAYSGSECEVQDCSNGKPAKAKAKDNTNPNANTPKEQAKDKAAQEKNALADKVPANLKKVSDFLR